MAIVVAGALTPLSTPAQAETPAEVLERYEACMERHDLDRIQELLWHHHNVQPIDARIYGLPQNDFDDRSPLTIQERLDFRAAKAADGVELATSGPVQYPHFLREALDHFYQSEGRLPDCEAILGESGGTTEDPELLGSGWATDGNVTDHDIRTRGEVNLAIDRANPNRLTVSSVPNGVAETSSFLAVSDDWGQTWMRGEVGLNDGYDWECDPVSYYQRSTGNVYHSKLACLTGTNCNTTHVELRRSEDHGATWSDCATRPGTLASEDREWITVDNTPTSPCYGTIYATWHNINSEKIASSSDNCDTWSTQVTLSPTYSSITADLNTAADGTAYVVWQQYNIDQFRVRGSTDCGQSWTAPYATNIKEVYGGANRNNIPAQCRRGCSMQPTIDVDRNPASDFYGRVYAVMFDYNASGCGVQANWNCDNWDANWDNANGCNMDVWFTYSDDQGSSWAPAANLTASDGNLVDNFMGYMRVDPADGSIYIGYHRSTLNPVALGDRQASHFFVTRSTDGGVTWETPFQASSLKGDMRIGISNAAYFERGDYNGIDVLDGVAWPVWVDRRDEIGEAEVIVRKVCSEPAHWTERSPTFTPPQVDVAIGATTATVTWAAPDIYWGDAGEDPGARKYQLWVDGAMAQDDIPWTQTWATHVPGDSMSHSYAVRAVNQCGLAKEYADRSATTCAENPDAVDVTPDGPLYLCTGASQLLTAATTGGSAGLSYTWYEDGAQVGTSSATYTATTGIGVHTYNCEAWHAACPTKLFDTTSTEIIWQDEPLFGGVESATPVAGASCAVQLAWSPGTALCAGPLTYNVYRSTIPDFVPGPGNLVATGVTGTGYTDSGPLVPLQTYYYVVRAVDQSNATEELNTVRAAGSAAAGSPVFFDDFDGADQGWTTELGTPPATSGLFVIGDPVGTVNNYGFPSQPEDDVTAAGTDCFYSAENPAGNAGVDDIDGGEVIGTSPTFNGAGHDVLVLDMWRWFGNEDGDDPGDYYHLEVSNDDGATWATVDYQGGEVVDNNEWRHVVFYLNEYVTPSATMKIRVRGADGTADVGDLVEVAIDEVRVTGYTLCTGDDPLFMDGFESAGTSRWAVQSP